MSAPITAPSVITHVRPAHCLLLPLLRHLLARFSDNHLPINTKRVPPLRQPPPWCKGGLVLLMITQALQILDRRLALKIKYDS
jgi:hypothetical protein